MKLRLMTLLAVLAAVATVVITAPTASAAKPAPTAVDVPVTGTVTDATGAVGTFSGEYTINRITTSGGELAAVGTVTGTVTNTATGATTTVSRAVTVPLQAAGTCEILDLTLGPLDLDLLGLVVHLDTVHLNITAESGPGNLLGNLLCAVAGLLDGPTGGLGGLLQSIVQLLNQILGQLGG